MKKYVVGIDIGGRSMKFGLFTVDGELIDKSSIITRIDDSGKYILPELGDHLEKIIEKYNLDKNNFVGIGLGIPGPVLNKAIARTAVNLGWYENVDIKEYLENRLGFEVLVENDANVAALGELWKGAAEGLKNIVMVTLGTGVGGGVVVDGKIVSGTTGSGGEIGHMPFLEKPLKRTCGCGGNRCFEQVASATGLEYIAQDYIFQHDEDTVLKSLDFIGGKEIFDAAKEGDKVANEIIDIYANYLGRGFGIISAIVDPSMFVIGGGVSAAGDVLLDRIKKAYKEVAFSVTADCEFKLAKLGNDAGIYGAAKLILS